MYPELRQISRFELLRLLRFEFLVFSLESEAILCVLVMRSYPVRFKVWRRRLRVLCGRSPRPLRFRM
jgi:hypothetical protein